MYTIYRLINGCFQVFCHEKGFPKGLLLRNFVNFYEFDILEERAFLQWKEDVNDAYPGKGKALFQVRMTSIDVVRLQ